MRARVTCAMLAVALLFCLIVPAYGASRFTDVAEGTETAEAAAYLVDRGLMSASGRKFHPDRKLTAAEWLQAVRGAFFTTDDARKPSWLESNGYVTSSERSRLDSGAVNWIMTWRVTLVLSKNWPVPDTTLSVAPQAEVEGIYADARATAVAMGLSSRDVVGINTMRRGDFAVYLYKLLTGRYRAVSYDYKSMPGSDLVDFGASETTQRTYRAWNAFVKAYGDLPGKYLDLFRRDGWKIVFSSTYTENGSSRAVQGGLCSYSTKRVYLNQCEERGVYHELGHFVMHRLNLDARARSAFAADGKAMKSVLWDYSQTDYSEYFADCTAYWLQGTDHAAMKSAGPETYALMRDVYDVLEAPGEGDVVEILDTPVPIGQFPFRDVGQGTWYRGGIEWAWAKGLMNGTAPGTFSPNGTTTRAMMVVMLHRMAGEPSVRGAARFADAASGSWYSAALDWGASTEPAVAVALDGGRFRPDELVTREQAVDMLYRYAAMEGLDVTTTEDLSRFADGSQVSRQYRFAMKWAVESGVIYGTDGNRLDPKGHTTRAEMAAILQRFFDGVPAVSKNAA